MFAYGCRVGSAGSAYIDFEDSLAVLLVMAEQQDGRYPRAAAKWAGRAITEKRLSLDDGRRVLALVDVMLTAAHAVVPHLRAYL